MSSSSSSDDVDEILDDVSTKSSKIHTMILWSPNQIIDGDVLMYNDIVKEAITVYGMTTSAQDATGRFGHTPLQKCTAAIRQLAYGSAADAVDEYLRIGESTALLCLHKFTDGIIRLFGEEYLRRPTPANLQRLLDIGETRGFPGMVGSIDCMHWEWKNCPTAWKRQYTRGSGKPTIVLEAVASQDLWRWHVFFGPPVQEATRKDVERAFGVLQARFAIVKNPALSMNKAKIGKIMRACIILHNMIVENERDGYIRYDISEFVEGNVTRSSEVETERPTNLNNMFPNRNDLRDRQIHERLKNDLIENIWNKFGEED
ncbi:uncharacterized protein LOC108871618 [Brassica rapa]|uniref:uncharacterized protein LOC108871618 n=1 Tax=Brassica campestris TaxID=3711 RepID=UPI00142E6848|nr:uncharacterized protein LOC108871618 [Brassica rapa]